jgi:hypothetical protein
MWARWGSNPRPIDYESTTRERCAHRRKRRSRTSETRTIICSLDPRRQQLPGAGLGSRSWRRRPPPSRTGGLLCSRRVWSMDSSRPQCRLLWLSTTWLWRQRRGRHTMCYVAWMSPPDPRYAASFEWDSGNEEHLARHDVSPYEVEQVSATILCGAATNAVALLSM